MAIPAEFKKLTDPTIPLQTGTVALNDLVHTVDVSDTDGGAAGTSKRTTIQKISDTIIGEIITPDLQEVTDAGNTTTNDILLDGSAIEFNSGSKLKNGTLDNGFGGGISQECSNYYEQEWENGVQYYFPLSSGLPNGVVYANSINGQVPDNTFDKSKGFEIASRYRLLNTGYEYICTDNTINLAVWELVNNADWNATSGIQEILNKPTIPAAQVNSDWNATSGVEEILNKPTIPATIVESVTSGTNVNVDNTDPLNPIINSLADRYKTSSITSNSVSNGTKNFTVDLDLAYIPLQEILVVYDPAHHMHGEVTSYNAATGALVVDIKTHTGSGTYTAWVLNLDGTPVDAITGSGTANEISYFTAGRVIASLPVATYPSLTELSYVKGVTSAIQTQINSLGGGGSTYKSTTDTTPVTGTILNTKVLSQLVPANTFTTGDILQLKARLSKTGALGISTLRIYINTADSLTVPAATLIGTSAFSGGTQTNFGIDKNIIIKSATITQTAPAASNLLADPTYAIPPLTNSNIDWTVDQYIIFAIQNANVGDSTVMSYFQIIKQ